ncbi:hypothetical protein SAMN03159343_4104 [Klenkia marina]|uniref:Homeodomain-like domain-containing protein n=1 Tax=Klenkia marina TaxID=1960309 RepID=A0A1G4Z490_9ACTN|nr:hypothetical protein [Klenkia marina]SCX60480.1 hypothetical protein SAMN03159343_4104 [Klenkia marina]
MSYPPRPQLAPGSVLRELQAAAAVRRAARIRVADAVADAVAEPDGTDHDSGLDVGDRRRAFATATARWVHLIKLAAAAGHPVSDIARAAGVAPSSIHYRLRPGRANTPEGP